MFLIYKDVTDRSFPDIVMVGSEVLGWYQDDDDSDMDDVMT
jgi:predicted DNA-binding transcriptional regulator AlpA